MLREKAIRTGISTECSCLLKFFHPSKKIDEVFVSRTDNDRSTGLIACRKELKKVNRRFQECIVFMHQSFSNEELHCVFNFCKVLKEGQDIDCFDEDTIVGPEESDEASVTKDEGVELPDEVKHLRTTFLSN